MIIEDWYVFYRMFKSEGANKVLSLFLLYAKDNIIDRTPELDEQLMQELNCLVSPREPEQVLKRLEEKGFLVVLQQGEEKEVYLLNPFLLWTGEDLERREEAKKDWDKLQKRAKGILNPYRISKKQFKGYRESFLSERESKTQIETQFPVYVERNKQLLASLDKAVKDKQNLEKRFTELKQGLKSLLKLSVNLVDISDVPSDSPKTEVKEVNKENFFADLFD